MSQDTDTNTTPGVSGLTTPQLNDGNVTDSSFAKDDRPEVNLIDLTTDIEAKLASIYKTIEKNDEEVNSRIDTLVRSIVKLEEELKAN